jgi:hypothetical protein
MITVSMNRNRIVLKTWIDWYDSPDGGKDGVGMGRVVEYDADTGAVVSDKSEPTGATIRVPPPDEDDGVFVGLAWAIPVGMCLWFLFGWRTK